jgi:chromosome segregation ATPase
VSSSLVQHQSKPGKVEKARNAASTWKNHYENAKPRLATMKERADRLEAELATVQTELEASKAQNASLQQQLSAVTAQVEALENQLPSTRPSAPMVQPENVDLVSVALNFGARTEKSPVWSRSSNLSAQNREGST